MKSPASPMSEHAAVNRPAHGRRLQPWPVRIMHLVNATAMLVMITSGWGIYDDVVVIRWLRVGKAWRLGDWAAWSARARESVLAGLPDPATGGLIDVLDAGGVPGVRDATVRPNQILAAGRLPFDMLPPALSAGLVAVVERTLLTPLGLRTLDPVHPEYCPQYRGDAKERDRAYHQGTAWPWLLGSFVAAWLAGRGHSSEAKAEARTRFLSPLQAHLAQAGLGHVSELADADPPHAPGGCPFQAWSLRELIRIEAMLGETDGL